MRALCLLLGLSLSALACQSSTPQQAQYPRGQYPQGQYPQGQGQQCAPGYVPSAQGCVPQQGRQCAPGYVPSAQGCVPQQGQQCAPGYVPSAQGCVPQQGPAPGPTAPPTGQPNPAGVVDPINTVNIVALRARAQAVIQELIAALPSDRQSRVSGIPLIVDDRPGEVNAFAACSKEGKAAMAISDGLMKIEAQLAASKATDEIFRTRKTDEYIAFISRNVKRNQPIPTPPAGFYDPAQHVDQRKLTRQRQLFDEQVAFVLGHELAHHYLGHLPCTGSGGGAATLGRILSSNVPVFNQPNELNADVQGVKNVLAAGQRRSGYQWNEGGALLTMQFFGGKRSLSASDVVFGFETTHPLPQIRLPVVQQTAATWRATGGRLPL